jgi:hypothetical protein
MKCNSRLASVGWVSSRRRQAVKSVNCNRGMVGKACEPEFKWQFSEWCHPQSPRNHKFGKVHSPDATKNVLRHWGWKLSEHPPYSVSPHSMWLRSDSGKRNRHCMGNDLQTSNVAYISASDGTDGVFRHPSPWYRMVGNPGDCFGSC